MEYYSFTPEEQKELIANPYTFYCGERTIKYTEEFEELFMEQHSQGIKASTIFKNCGYRIEVLGHQRIENYYCRLRKTSRYRQRHHGETAQTTISKNIIGTKPSLNYSSMPPLKALEMMQTELTYLRQEVEYLKKISSLANKPRGGIKL